MWLSIDKVRFLSLFLIGLFVKYIHPHGICKGRPIKNQLKDKDWSTFKLKSELRRGSRWMSYWTKEESKEFYKV